MPETDRLERHVFESPGPRGRGRHHDLVRALRTERVGLEVFEDDVPDLA